MAGRDDERFLDEAVARGLLTREQAESCRRLTNALGEVDVALTVDEILARKGFLARERSAELRRALARQRVGRYEVLERLGEGGSGIVWKARDVTLDRLVALKLLSREARENPAWRERFLREARTAVTLNHAGLVRGLDCGEADGYLYFAMEYVPGETVGARLRREGRIPEKDALRIAAEVVGVLRYVAALGIVHRDLKPDNLLVTPEGRVKVCDLGLAKPTREEADRGGAESFVAGTPLYVAPEQIRDGDRVDWRADVYSLGATLYHMLAGRPPFLYEKGKDLLARHLTEIPPSPREFALDVTANAAAVVLKSLQKDPADRYARLEDLESDLEAVIAGRPPIHTISFAPRDRPSVDAAAARAAAGPAAPGAARWVPVAASVLVLAVIAAGAILYGTTWLGTWTRGRAPGPGTVPRRPPAAAPANPVPPAPAPSPPTRPVTAAPETPAESEARRALETARKFATSHPEDLAANRDAFQFVADRHAGTAAAEIAAGLVTALAAEMERVGADALAAARTAAATAEARGRFGEALRTFDTVTAAHAGTAAAAAAQTEVRRLRETADARLVALLDLLRDDVAAREFDGARAHLHEAADLGLPWAEVRLAQRRRELDEAEAAFAQERAATRDTFERVWGAALLDAGAKGAAAALDTLDRAQGSVQPWSREIDDLRIELRHIAEAPERPSATASPLDLRSAFYARLAHRDFAGAESLLPSLEAAGLRIDLLREAEGRVRRVLVALADGCLAEAESARADGRLDDAARHVDLAFAEVPDHPRARVAAAAILAARGRTDQAIAELEQVLLLPSPPPEAHLRLALCLAPRREAAALAQMHFDLYLRLSRDADPFRSEARAAMDRFVVTTTKARIGELRAEIFAAREPQAAIAAGEQLVALGADEADFLIALGDAYAKVDRAHDAYLAYRRVPADRPLIRDAAKVRDRLRTLDQRYAATTIERDEAADARNLLESGDVAGARAKFEASLRRAPFFEESLAGASDAWLARKGHGAYALADDPKRALRLTEVLLARNPAHVRGTELRAEALRRAGRTKEALALAVEALALDTLRPEPATTAGYAALALGDASAALAHFQESLGRRHTPQGYLGCATAWERLGRRQAARDVASMLLEEFPVPDELRDEVDGLLARLDMEALDLPK